MRIATVNVNGIRAAFRKGMGEWLAARQPDVVLLQETRAPQEIIAEFFPGADGWNLASHPSEIKGRAGVAIASRLPLLSATSGLGSGGIPADATDNTNNADSSDAVQRQHGSANTKATQSAPEPPVDTGRWIEADIELLNGNKLTVVSAYFHSGTNTPEMAHTMTAKYAHLDKAEKRLKELAENDHPVIVCGDFNIAHENCDIANWKGNKNSAGFLPQERAYLTKWFSDDGWTDLGRKHAGDIDGPYTWWSWRGQAFTNDTGWRIDYQIGNPSATALMREIIVDRPQTYEQRWSDHAPVIGEFDFR